MLTTRRCPRCREEKPLCAFRRRAAGTPCRKCVEEVLVLAQEERERHYPQPETRRRRSSACSKRAKAKRRGAPLADVDVKETREWIARCQSGEEDCCYCGAPADTHDHFIPLSKGGAHHWTNIGPACASCNNRKLAMPVLAFLERLRQTAELTIS